MFRPYKGWVMHSKKSAKKRTREIGAFGDRGDDERKASVYAPGPHPLLPRCKSHPLVTRTAYAPVQATSRTLQKPICTGASDFPDPPKTRLHWGKRPSEQAQTAFAPMPHTFRHVRDHLCTGARPVLQRNGPDLQRVSLNPSSVAASDPRSCPQMHLRPLRPAPTCRVLRRKTNPALPYPLGIQP